MTIPSKICITEETRGRCMFPYVETHVFAVTVPIVSPHIAHNIPLISEI